jgi:CRISPR-associated protein Csm1
MDERVLNAALAGLLHDVGKLVQRARVDPWKIPEGMEQEGQPVHAAHSIAFIQAYVPEAYRSAALAGAYHHAPGRSPSSDPWLSELTALADQLSAGERADPAERQKHPPRQMVTIFDRICLDGQARVEGDHWLPLKPLSLSESTLFPQNALSPDPEGHAYQELVEGLQKEIRRLQPDYETYLEQVQSTLQRFAWSVPSAFYHSIPDISLYDHSRMTAALAACLAGWKTPEIQELKGAVTRQFLEEPEPGDEARLARPVVLLVGGDISGIQKFIYTLSSKRAAKTLRGRSFYLQLLTEAVLRFILDALSLPYTNVIYAGGGHFFLLAPLEAASQLESFRAQVTRKLQRHHGISLYLALGWSKVPAGGFRAGKFPEHWRRMHRELAMAKTRRYTELGDDELFAQIFQPPEHGGNPDATCSVCGEDRLAVTDLKDPESEEINLKICTLCQSFDTEIGRRLPESRFIALGFQQSREMEPGTASAALGEFGMSFSLLENAQAKTSLQGARRVVTWALDDPINDHWPTCDPLPVAHWLHFTVNRIPPATFDELEQKVEGGFEKLGVLRMDVDSLGEIFSRGLAEPEKPGSLSTLARLSTLSFQVSLFFEGWVKVLCEGYENLIYAVYAGGDDLFLIGPWDRMPDLALKIRNDFTRYTGMHPALHISGGMAFIGGKYPVYQAARDAEEAERQAKGVSGKNAFSFLNRAWKWEEFEALLSKKQRLDKITGGKERVPDSLEGPSELLNALRQMATAEEEAANKRGRPVWGRWLWIGPYRLTRMVERYQKDKPALADAITGLRDELSTQKYATISHWGAAARWTQLDMRKKIHKDKTKQSTNL